jgi:hypothetical protein
VAGSGPSNGGGGYAVTFYNCIVYFNEGEPGGGGANYDPSSTLNYCCTTPLPANGVANITNAPLFVDYASGNLRLQSNSPCINAGNNAYVTTATDLNKVWLFSRNGADYTSRFPGVDRLSRNNLRKL